MGRFRRDIGGIHFENLHHFKGAFFTVVREQKRQKSIRESQGRYPFPRYSLSKATGLWAGPILDRRYSAEVVEIDRDVFLKLAIRARLRPGDLIYTLIQLSSISLRETPLGHTVWYRSQERPQYCVIDKKIFERRSKR